MRIEDLRPVVAPQQPKDLAFEDAGLAQRLDRGRPCPAVVAVAVLDLDGHARSRRSSRRRRAAPAGSRCPRSASMPALLTTRPGIAFISEVSSRSRLPPTISGCASIASRTVSSAGASDARGSSAAHGRRVGEHRVGLGDLAQRERVGEHAAAVDRRPELVPAGPRRPARRPRGTRHGPGGPSPSSPRAAQPLQTREQEEHRVLPGAHVADRAGPLAVARQPRRGQLVQRHALGAAGEERLRDAGPPEHAPGASGRGGPRRSGSWP